MSEVISEPLKSQDPDSDPEVLDAAALTRFAWGEIGRLNYNSYLELMNQRYGLDQQAANEVLARLNSTIIQRPEI